MGKLIASIVNGKPQTLNAVVRWGRHHKRSQLEILAKYPRSGDIAYRRKEDKLWPSAGAGWAGSAINFRVEDEKSPGIVDDAYIKYVKYGRAASSTLKVEKADSTRQTVDRQ